VNVLTHNTRNRS